MFHSPFGPEFAFVALTAAESADYRLSAPESELISARAAAKRRVEFTLGRAAAHAALRKLGFSDPPPVLRGSGREPLWPEGIIGSISHTGRCAVAVVTRRNGIRGLGIDLQPLETRRRPEIAHHVCTEGEYARLAELPEDERAELTIAIFSAKESVYKAFYPLCRRYLGFRDVELGWGEIPGMMSGTLRVQLGERFAPGYAFDIGCCLVTAGDEGEALFTYTIL